MVKRKETSVKRIFKRILVIWFRLKCGWYNAKEDYEGLKKCPTTVLRMLRLGLRKDDDFLKFRLEMISELKRRKEFHNE